MKRHGRSWRRKVEEGADPEEQDEYTAKNVFWVPQEARWDYLRSQAREPTIGSTVDDAMSTIEGANPSLKDVLPKDYGLPSLDKRVIGQLIDMISDIEIGDRESRSKDVLGRVYEYFLSQFASAEGKRGGEFYTPRCIVNLLVGDAGAVPWSGLRSVLRVVGDVRAVGQVYRGTCDGQRERWKGSGRYIDLRSGVELHDVAVGEDELGDQGYRRADRAGQHVPQRPASGPEGRLTYSPIRRSTYRIGARELLTEDQRWRYGTPPRGNANFAWVQHMVYHLSPKGVAGIVLANGSMSSNQSNEGRDTQEPDREANWWTA